MKALTSLLAIVLIVSAAQVSFAESGSLPNTARLHEFNSDPASAMVAGIDQFLLSQIRLAEEQRGAFWHSADGNHRNVAFLQERMGWPARVAPSSPLQYQLPPIAQSPLSKVWSIRWPVLPHPAPHLRAVCALEGSGLLVRPANGNGSLVILIGDAGHAPEHMLNLLSAENCDIQQQTAHQLLAAGFTLVIPRLIDRQIHQHGNARMTRREFIQRAAYELGQTLTGYEVQTVLALLDRDDLLDDGSPGRNSAAEVNSPATLNGRKIVLGFGEGGRLALLAGALDARIDTTVCCGYFGPRDGLWREPVSRNIFGYLERFGDAELAALIAPRKLAIHSAPRFSVSLLSGAGGAPGEWQSPALEQVRAEFALLQRHCATQSEGAGVPRPELLDDISNGTSVASQLDAFVTGRQEFAAEQPALEWVESELNGEDHRAERDEHLFATWVAYNQVLLEESEYRRADFMNLGLPRDDLDDGSNRLDTSSIEAYNASVESFRNVFREDIIGSFSPPTAAMRPRSRVWKETSQWIAHEVVLDVFPDVFAYGILLVPRDLVPEDTRPVVVCQHGLEGRPSDTITGDHRAYHDFAAQLCERGFIVFAPQNPYIGQDAFRTLQRKANTIGKTLFSVIAAQHQQIVSWLAELPFVDADRIAFYGLSYGGKSAMRLPALIPEYCMSICSADFNDWVWKNASSRSAYSYMGTGEYEIFEFGLGPRFNYAEMAALIAPRPFMVERGHFDGVAPDDRVAKEFAKVRFLYAARLGLPRRCSIEWFVGPHTIHGKETFNFLHHHLNWPVPPAVGEEPQQKTD